MAYRRIRTGSLADANAAIQYQKAKLFLDKTGLVKMRYPLQGGGSITVQRYGEMEIVDIVGGFKGVGDGYIVGLVDVGTYGTDGTGGTYGTASWSVYYQTFTRNKESAQWDFVFGALQTQAGTDFSLGSAAGWQYKNNAPLLGYNTYNDYGTAVYLYGTSGVGYKYEAEKWCAHGVNTYNIGNKIFFNGVGLAYATGTFPWIADGNYDYREINPAKFLYKIVGVVGHPTWVYTLWPWCKLYDLNTLQVQLLSWGTTGYPSSVTAYDGTNSTIDVGYFQTGFAQSHHDSRGKPYYEDSYYFTTTGSSGTSGTGGTSSTSSTVGTNWAPTWTFSGTSWDGVGTIPADLNTYAYCDNGTYGTTGTQCVGTNSYVVDGTNWNFEWTFILPKKVIIPLDYNWDSYHAGELKGYPPNASISFDCVDVFDEFVTFPELLQIITNWNNSLEGVIEYEAVKCTGVGTVTAFTFDTPIAAGNEGSFWAFDNYPYLSRKRTWIGGVHGTAGTIGIALPEIPGKFFPRSKLHMSVHMRWADATIEGLKVCRRFYYGYEFKYGTDYTAGAYGTYGTRFINSQGVGISGNDSMGCVYVKTNFHPIQQFEYIDPNGALSALVFQSSFGSNNVIAVGSLG
jgi:hypothetical protein